MLLHARDKAEEVMGYDWLCTVLVAQGRSFPWLPIAVVMVWSVLVCCIMLFVCKTNLMLRETGGEEGLDIKNVHSFLDATAACLIPVFTWRLVMNRKTFDGFGVSSQQQGRT